MEQRSSLIPELLGETTTKRTAELLGETRARIADVEQYLSEHPDDSSVRAMLNSLRSMESDLMAELALEIPNSS